MDPRADLKEATKRNAWEEREAAERRTAQATKEQADAAAKAQAKAAAAETEAEACTTGLRCSLFPSVPWPPMFPCPRRRRSTKARR